MIDFEALRDAMADLDEDVVLEMMNTVMAEGGHDAQKAMAACQEGIKIVGSRFESGEYFVGDLIYSGEVMSGAIEIIKPALAGSSESSCGRMILCTVKDDLHDIGKNIVRSMLEAAGLEVLDLGIDVPADVVVETAKRENIKIIALSGVLTLALDSMRNVVEKFTEANMRKDVKIIIGGNPVSEENCHAIGADEWAHSPQKTVDTCVAWAKA